ncbi:hypothetical protein C8R44DRAFT_883660 [Mycena epipterygia]|nr:hypothetical protein C8R44DRAFT_883660 [Mycena epipterygia]
MRDFAQELIDNVIDCWRLADPKGMQLCGLVCKRWLDRSRYHLFSIVPLDTKNLGAFVNLVDTSSLPILSFVRHLALFYHDSPLHADHLARLHDCPNLTRITIRTMDVGGRNLPTVDWLASHESLQTHLRAWSAKSLSLSSLELGLPSIDLPLRTLADLICCVPSVKSLKVFGDLDTRVTATAVPLTLGPTRLANLGLFIYSGGGGLILSWLLSLPVLPILGSFVLKTFRNEDASAIEEYFRRAGEGLESLEINSLGDNVVLERRILPYTPNLQRLNFFCPHASDIFNTLALLSSSRCNAITVRTEGLEDGELSWTAFDTVLADPKFRNLKQLSVLGLYNETLITPEVRALMPLANARGILN